MEALLYDRLEHKKVRCKVCQHYCIIEDGKRGICNVRKNINGDLMTLNYGYAIAVSVDPIEKKPIYEFLSRTHTYSFAAEGCNMHCPWCQNHNISQISRNHEVKGYQISPQQHVDMALQYQTPSISYTYSEPTIFLEYAYETMKLAHENNIKNIWVTNGYMSKETLDLILPYVDAFNVDYKGDNSVYKQYCGGAKKHVLQTLKRIHDEDKHLEITTLIIPGINDTPEQISALAGDLIEEIGKDFVWHLTRFHPQYKMKHISITSRDTMYQALKIARDKGIKSVYLGNI